MNETVFRNDDRAYLAWIAQHPQGFVLNRQKGTTDRYLVLHRARCRQVRLARDNDDAYTGRHYIKVCADQIEALEAHARQQGGLPRRCRVCNP